MINPCCVDDFSEEKGKCSGLCFWVRLASLLDQGGATLDEDDSLLELSNGSYQCCLSGLEISGFLLARLSCCSQVDCLPAISVPRAAISEFAAAICALAS